MAAKHNKWKHNACVNDTHGYSASPYYNKIYPKYSFPEYFFPNILLINNDINQHNGFIHVYGIVWYLHTAACNGKGRHYMGVPHVSYIKATSTIDIIGPKGIQSLLESATQEETLWINPIN